MPDFSFNVMEVLILKSLTIKNSQINEKNTLYQTKSPSLREMSLPNIPVKPARITAMWSNTYDLFIKIYLPTCPPGKRSILILTTGFFKTQCYSAGYSLQISCLIRIGRRNIPCFYRAYNVIAASGKDLHTGFSQCGIYCTTTAT
jgi:hypothetical protein